MAKFLLGEANAQEIEEVSAWLAEKPEHQVYFNQLAEVWKKSIRLNSLDNPNTDKAWQNFQQRIRHGEMKPESPVRSVLVFVRIAAVLVMMLMAAGIVFSLLKFKPSRPIAVNATLQPISDTLPDGSIVDLNKNASLSYPSEFEGQTRPVTLRGEAFFKVSPDKKKPFVITTGKIQVTVVGTSFNIKQGADSTEVIVETGQVKVQSANQEIMLYPGEKVIASSKDGLLRKEKATDQLYNYYRTKTFVCRETRLWKLVDVLNEAYSSNIIIERPELRDLTIDATFREEKLDRVLELISETFSSYQIRVIKNDKQIILK